MNIKSPEIQIRRLRSTDLIRMKELILLFNTVFKSNHPQTASDKNIGILLAKQEFVVYAAFHKEIIVGGVTAYELGMYDSEQPELFLYDIAVKVEFQRQGIGKTLLIELKKHCKERKIRLLFVAADKGDSHALKFYAESGGQGNEVVHFNYPIPSNSI
jgi:aminoglycoside 3-N-acetyltransferase I